jgi:hypothetical protein
MGMVGELVDFSVNSFDNLYTVAFRQFTMGRIVWLGCGCDLF